MSCVVAHPSVWLRSLAGSAGPVQLSSARFIARLVSQLHCFLSRWQSSALCVCVLVRSTFLSSTQLLHRPRSALFGENFLTTQQTKSEKETPISSPCLPAANYRRSPGQRPRSKGEGEGSLTASCATLNERSCGRQVTTNKPANRQLVSGWY